MNEGIIFINITKAIKVTNQANVKEKNEISSKQRIQKAHRNNEDFPNKKNSNSKK